MLREEKKDKLNFYNISQGSLEELKYYFVLTKDLGYCKDAKELLEFSNEIGKMLGGLVNSIKKSKE